MNLLMPVLFFVTSIALVGCSAPTHLTGKSRPGRDVDTDKVCLLRGPGSRRR